MQNRGQQLKLKYKFIHYPVNVNDLQHFSNLPKTCRMPTSPVLLHSILQSLSLRA